MRALFGLLTRRLVRGWPDVDSYTVAAEGRAATDDPGLREGFRAWSEAVLRADGDGFRPALDPRRLVADGVDSLTRPPGLGLLQRPGAPVHLLAAAHGADDRRAPFLSDGAVAVATRALPGLTWDRLPANHATMLFHPAVAAAVGEMAAR